MTGRDAPLLRTQHLILRRPAPRDWDAARAFFMSDRAAHVGGRLGLGQAWRSFAAELGHWEIFGHGMWAVTRAAQPDEPAIALIGPWTPPDWPETEIGWMILADDLEGTGIAHEAATAAIDHAWRVLGWDTVVSYVRPANARSIRLAERLGAVIDRDAPQPRPEDPCLVYRHPRPAGI